MSRSSQQRHHHGVKKNLVEGIGGVLVGTALVLLICGIVKRRVAEKATAGQNESMISATSGDLA